MIKIGFHGAAETVTGSKFVVQTNQAKILIDGGLFQGRKSLRRRNREGVAFDPKELEAIVVTHAHIDHIGYLPRLVKDGFSGPIYMTPPTADLAGILLADSARIQEEEARYAARKGYSKHNEPEPLYDSEDAVKAIDLIRRVNLHTQFQVAKGIEVRYHNAGHILGSAWVELWVEDEGETRKIVFSGDLGRTDAPILKDPEQPVACDYLVVESTYGDRLHGEHDIEGKLSEVLEDVCQKKGRLIIPAFATERSQEILYLLHRLRGTDGICPMKIFMDSPLAIKATKIFRQYEYMFDEEAKRWGRKIGPILDHPDLEFTESVEASKAILAAEPPYVVIAGSGMATAGRVLHHLKNHVSNPTTTVLLVGYQAVGSRGWRLQEGEEEIKIFGDWYPVKATIDRLEGFSGHADYSQIDVWRHALQEPPKKTFLVHGEPKALEASQERFQAEGWDAIIPQHEEWIELA